MTVRLYKSTDASAPSLTGQAGSLTTLLDAVLVNGYGSQTAAGWTIAYTGTNKRDYRQGSGSNSYYLDVDDSAPTTAKEARMRGYEAMTALATGTQAFPTAAQSSFGTVCRKSTTADATARVWYCVADATCFYLFVDTGDFTNPAYSMAFHFGDFFSYKASDAYGCAIIGRSAENTGANANEALPALNPISAALTAAAPGHYVDRMWTGAGGSIGFGKHSSALACWSSDNLNYKPTCSGTAAAVCAYPNGPDGALELAPFWIGHNGSIRGYLKGLWVPCHNQPTGHADTFTGTGNMSGKSFLSLNMQSTLVIGGQSILTATGQIVVETSDTWS